MKTLTAVLLSAVGIACAAPAYADDAQFLQRVSGLHGDRGALIALAHDYCAALPLPSVGWGGPSPLWQAMQPIRSRLGALGNDPTSEVFAFAAEDSYCPGADQLRQH